MGKFRDILNIKIPIAIPISIGVVIGIGLLSVNVGALVPGVNTLGTYDSGGTVPSTGSGNLRAHISENGREIVWFSWGRDVIANEPSPLHTGPVLYKRNLDTGSTSYVAIDVNNTPAEVASGKFAISRTGRYVAFDSKELDVVTSPVLVGTNRTHIYLRDTLLDTTKLIDQSALGVPANLNDGAASTAVNISDDGRFVLFKSESNNLLSVGNSATKSGNYYIKDMVTGEVINPAMSEAGVRANATSGYTFSSCDGSLVAFGAAATNLTPQDNGQMNVYLVDIRNGFKISNLTYNANQYVSLVSMSCNGRYLVMNSMATNLTSDPVTGTNAHHYRYDRLTGEYSLIDQSTGGYISTTDNPHSNASESMRTVSDDGKVVFRNNDKNMISPAALRASEVYMRNPELGSTELVPVNSSGVEQNQTGQVDTLEINAQGTVVIYNSKATNLVSGVTSNSNMLVLSKVE